MTIQEFHRVVTGNLMSTSAVSVDVGCFNSTIAEGNEAEVTSDITRGQGNDIVKMHHHDLSPLSASGEELLSIRKDLSLVS